jgi:hypothetical protein
VPDLLAVFEHDGLLLSVLIEVKSTNREYGATESDTLSQARC